MPEDRPIRTSPLPPAPQPAAVSPPVAPADRQLLAEHYANEFLKTRQGFESTGNGCAALRARSDLMDGIVLQLQNELLPGDLPGQENLSLVALGGYGRQELFPHSDVDLLFLFTNQRAADSRREDVAALSRALWDLHLRVGPTTRTLADCGELHRDNLEFNIALLDCRYLAGDSQLFAHLRDEVIPHLVARDRLELVRELAGVTAQRHAKYGGTIFHLEPNVKETPGGLRDYHLCRWLARIAELEKSGNWTAPEELWPAPLGVESRLSYEFLCAVRCFLHYAQGRDDNQLSYELQEQAAAQGVGSSPGRARPAAEWMRDYFRHARSIHRLSTRLFEDAIPAQSSLYGLFQDWRQRLSNADFSVLRGRIFPRQPSALREDPGLLLDLFEMTARHGFELSREAEKAVAGALDPSNAWALSRLSRMPLVWTKFQRVLTLPRAANALRDMNRLGLLTALFPEFKAIDSLVIRDFYHRYTVDEHSFLTIQSLHALAAGRARKVGEGESQPAGPSRPGGTLPDWEKRFAEIWSELERPALLLFALLFHDVGKGMPEADHIRGSLQALESIGARLDVPPEDQEAISFLVTHHLEMSATCQRRDVFDPETVRAFTEKVGTPERLKMLCLLTYADVKAVNPEALTPWRAELLWQLYVAAMNHLTRSVDEERVETAGPPADGHEIERILALYDPSDAPEVWAFLRGLPRRYLLTHSPAEVAGHFAMARQVARDSVQVELATRNHHFELTVLTPDRPFLFASITGTLAAWGMSIIKADAFSNAAGLVLDMFRFVDLYRTLELNPSEKARLKANLVEVLKGELELSKLLSGRMNFATLPSAKVKVPTQIHFDDASSSHSTLLELIAQDRPGLLYQVSSRLAELGCNIEIALIDTEGQKAIDVFYLTSAGAKLDSSRQLAIRDALLESL